MSDTTSSSPSGSQTVKNDLGVLPENLCPNGNPQCGLNGDHTELDNCDGTPIICSDASHSQQPKHTVYDCSLLTGQQPTDGTDDGVVYMTVKEPFMQSIKRRYFTGSRFQRLTLKVANSCHEALVIGMRLIAMLSIAVNSILVNSLVLNIGFGYDNQPLLFPVVITLCIIAGFVLRGYQYGMSFSLHDMLATYNVKRDTWTSLCCGIAIWQTYLLSGILVLLHLTHSA